jgi:hypothetical protein
VHGWIDPFYAASEKAIEPGEIWSDQPIYLPPRHGLKLGRVDPRDDRNLELQISGRTRDIFDHPPVHSMKLGVGESAVVAKAKWDRPVIILGGRAASEILPQRERAEHVETVMAVPVYGADQYDAHIRERIAYYDFTNLFYLPASKDPPFDEGFARLDHAQPVFTSHLRQHRGLRLSPDALDALVEWYVAYATERHPEDSLILEYRREMLGGGGE